MFKYILNFLKAMKGRHQFQNYFSLILYKLNYRILTEKYRGNVPDLKEENFQILNIKFTDEELNTIYNDLKIKNYIFEKNSYKYLLYNYPCKYLEQLNYAWGFDRTYYAELIKKKLGPQIKSYYHNLNYRIEHIWLYETLPNSQNMNEKFHTDNDMIGGMKCLIYITDVDLESGPFEVYNKQVDKYEKILGEKGTVVFFNQSKLLHANSKNKSKNRIILSFNIYPSIRKNIFYQKTKPLNALHTLNPFTGKS